MMPQSDHKVLKKDLFGQVLLHSSGERKLIIRDTSAAPVWTRWIARRLLAREARVLAAADGMLGLPAIHRVSTDRLERDHIAGSPLQVARPTDPQFFSDALRLLRRLHRSGIVHNDLAKEPNLLVTPEGKPALIDFQLAWYAPKRGRLFCLLGREDLRHLLKHKRYYCREHLTARERRILDTPSWPSRIWMKTGKPLYLFITRRILGWADREGAADRHATEDSQR